MIYPDLLISDSVERLLGDLSTTQSRECMARGEWPAREWEEIEASGFANILSSPPADARDPSGWADAWSVFHCIGRYGLPLPLSETILAGALLARVGVERPAGPLSIAMPGPNLTLRTDAKGQLLLDGKVTAVPWARYAHALVFAGDLAGEGILACIDMAGGGVRIVPGHNLAMEPRDTVVFDRCRCAAVVKSRGNLPQDAAMRFGAVARAAMIAGASQWALDLAVSYANERSQFGRPIGRFQAIQHLLAVAAGDVAAATLASTVTCCQSDAQPIWFDVAVAKIRADSAAGRVAQVAHQVYGAIGFTEEHVLHQATKRLLSWRSEFGTGSWWAQALGRAAIVRGGIDFWSGMTARQIAPEGVA